MLLAVLGGYVWRSVLGAIEDIGFRQIVLSVVLRACLVSVDVLPCLRVNKRELVRRDAQHGAVFLMQWEDIEREGSAQELVHEGKAGSAVKEGAREAGEGMEVEIVDLLLSYFAKILSIAPVLACVRAKFKIYCQYTVVVSLIIIYVSYLKLV